MKRSILVLAVVALFLPTIGAAAAAAGGYYIPPLKAKRIARETSESICESEEGCIRYGWGCEEAGRGALCILTGFYEGEYAEIECEESLHLTIGAGGFIRKSFGKTHCFALE